MVHLCRPQEEEQTIYEWITSRLCDFLSNAEERSSDHSGGVGEDVLTIVLLLLCFWCQAELSRGCVWGVWFSTLYVGWPFSRLLHEGGVVIPAVPQPVDSSGIGATHVDS